MPFVSIKVNGPPTVTGGAAASDDKAAPATLTKRAALQALKKCFVRLVPRRNTEPVFLKKTKAVLFLRLSNTFYYVTESFMGKPNLILSEVRIILEVAIKYVRLKKTIGLLKTYISYKGGVRYE